MSKLNSIKLFPATLKKVDGGRTELRGVLDLECLHLLQTDDYQRGVQSPSSHKSIYEALDGGEPLPDVELGMRGIKFHMRDGAYFLEDPVFIIDGLQRTSSVNLYRTEHPEKKMHLGAIVYFDTTVDWERERFGILNTKRDRVSPNKLLSNRRHTSDGVMTLYRLSQAEKDFALKDRLTWNQRQTRTEFLGAMSVAKVIIALHTHAIGYCGESGDEVVKGLNKIHDDIGLQAMRANTIAFFDLVDGSWGLRHIQRTERAPQLGVGFLTTLARLISNAPEFWRQPDQKRLFVDSEWKRNFRKFKVTEPSHRELTGAVGKPLDRLFIYVYEEINKGKHRHKRLKLRPGRYHILVESISGDPIENAK